MPRFIIKPERDVDQYVLWSTITDGPLVSGSRQELEAYGRHYGEDVSPERFDRADANGSSAFSEFGRWEDNGLITSWTHDGMTEMGPHWLPRENLGRWLRTGDVALVDPLKD